MCEEISKGKRSTLECEERKQKGMFSGELISECSSEDERGCVE